MAKTKCSKPECQNQAVIFISRRDNEKNAHLYCCTQCANQDQPRREKLFPYVNEMEKSSRVAHGDRSQAPSKHASLIEKEKKEIAITTTKLQNKGTGKIQRNTGPMKNVEDTETSTESESETELDQRGFDEKKNHMVKSEVSTLNLEEARSQSTNLLDESILCMHELMLSVKENVKQKNKKSEYHHVDPQQVNAAVNCAREMANLMKVKIQVMKEMGK